MNQSQYNIAKNFVNQIFKELPAELNAHINQACANSRNRSLDQATRNRLAVAFLLAQRPEIQAGLIKDGFSEIAAKTIAEFCTNSKWYLPDFAAGEVAVASDDDTEEMLKNSGLDSLEELSEQVVVPPSVLPSVLPEVESSALSITVAPEQPVQAPEETTEIVQEEDETDDSHRREGLLADMALAIEYLKEQQAATGSLSEKQRKTLKLFEEKFSQRVFDEEEIAQLTKELGDIDFSEEERQWLEQLRDIDIIPTDMKGCYDLAEKLAKNASDLKVSQDFVCKHLKDFFEYKRPKPMRQMSETKLDELIKQVYKTSAGIFCEGLVELWRSPDGVEYATITKEGHNEHWAVESQIFTGLIQLWYHRKNNKYISETALKSAIRMHKAKALLEGKQYETALRVAEYEGNYYFDLGNANWEVLEVGSDLPYPGWRIIPKAPVKFIRNATMEALPIPEAAGTEVFAELMAMLNFEDKDSEVMFVCFLVCCLGVLRAYPVLVLSAGEGTLKTFLLRTARRLTDPNTHPDRTPPKDEQDFVTSALYSRVPSWDNLRDVPDWLSDALCRIAYGINHGTKKHYEQGVEFLMKALRPAIIAGIGTLAVRHDLLQRSFMPRLKKVAYKTDEQAEADFLAIYPRLLGALFSAVSGAMKRLPHTQLGDDPPRMAGAYKWCLAAAPDLGYTEADIKHAFDTNRAEGAAISIESSPMTQFIESKLLLPWTGTCEELLHTAQVSLKGSDRIGLPKTANGVSNLLTRQQEALKRMGIVITKLPRHSRRKLIRIEETPERKADKNQVQELHKTDPWCALLGGWSQTQNGFTSFDVYTLLGFKPYQVSIEQQQRLHNVLKDLGFAPVQDKWYLAKWTEAL